VCAASPDPPPQEKKLVLENLKTHKDNSQRLTADMNDAAQANMSLLHEVSELEDTFNSRSGDVAEKRKRLAHLEELLNAVQVLKAKRDTILAENQRRKAALRSEVMGSTLEGLTAMLVRPLPGTPPSGRRQLNATQESYESKHADFRNQHSAEMTRLSDARITLAHLQDVHAREAAKQVRALAAVRPTDHSFCSAAEPAAGGGGGAGEAGSGAAGFRG